MMHEMANGNRNRCANMAIEEGGKTTMENISDVHLVQHHCDGHHDRPSPFSYECTSDNYDRAIAWCHEIITSGQQHSMALFSLPSFHSELSSASQKFNMPFESLHSLFRNVHVSYMKRSSHTLRSSTMRHVKSYLNGCSIVDLAKKANCPPTLMARLIVENVIATTTINAANTSPNTTATTNNTNSSSNLNAGIDATYKKKLVSEALRHPERSLGCASTSILPEYLFSENAGKEGKRKKNEDKRDIHNDEVEEPRIPLSRLSLEVREAVDSDPMYGKRERISIIFTSQSNSETKNAAFPSKYCFFVLLHIICSDITKGPRHDKERHNIGIEYELLLEETLCSMGKQPDVCIKFRC